MYFNIHFNLKTAKTKAFVLSSETFSVKKVSNYKTRNWFFQTLTIKFVFLILRKAALDVFLIKSCGVSCFFLCVALHHISMTSNSWYIRLWLLPKSGLLKMHGFWATIKKQWIKMKWWMWWKEFFYCFLLSTHFPLHFAAAGSFQQTIDFNFLTAPAAKNATVHTEKLISTKSSCRIIFR